MTTAVAKPATGRTARAPQERIAEAFPSPATAARLLLLLALLLVLPLLLARLGIVSRPQAYAAMPTAAGPYGAIAQQVFAPGPEVDVLFVGDAALRSAIDTTAVERAISRISGRPAHILLFATEGRGEDMRYALLHDVLERRRVRMVVLSQPSPLGDEPDPYAYRFIEDGLFRRDLAGFPLRDRIRLYAGNVLSAPRQLLSMLRRDGPSLDSTGGEPNPASVAPVQSVPTAHPLPAATIVTENGSQAASASVGLERYQERFLALTLSLLQRKQVPVAVLSLPTFAGRHEQRIEEAVDWRRLGPVYRVQISPAGLFAGFTDVDVRRLFTGDRFNRNGNQLFTQAVLPAISSLYHDHALPR